MTHPANITPIKCVIEDDVFIRAQIVLPENVSAIAVEAERCPVEGLSLIDARFVENGMLAFDAIMPFVKRIKAGILEVISPALEVTSFKVSDDEFFVAEVTFPNVTDSVWVKGELDMVQGVFIESVTWPDGDTSAIGAVVPYLAQLIEVLGHNMRDHVA